MIRNIRFMISRRYHRGEARSPGSEPGLITSTSWHRTTRSSLGIGSVIVEPGSIDPFASLDAAHAAVAACERTLLSEIRMRSDGSVDWFDPRGSAHGLAPPRVDDRPVPATEVDYPARSRGDGPRPT
jgi:hypothetical protein